jgi:DUF917 family protein
VARALQAAQIEALAVGAALLGAGGGGSPDLVAPLLRRRLGGRSHPVLALADLDPNALVVPVGVVGATQAAPPVPVQGPAGLPRLT